MIRECRSAKIGRRHGAHYRASTSAPWTGLRFRRDDVEQLEANVRQAATPCSARSRPASTNGETIAQVERRPVCSTDSTEFIVLRRRRPSARRTALIASRRVHGRCDRRRSSGTKMPRADRNESSTAFADLAVPPRDAVSTRIRRLCDPLLRDRQYLASSGRQLAALRDLLLAEAGDGPDRRVVARS